MVAEPYSGFAQKYNMIIGILLCAFITNILFLLLPFGLFFIADIFLVIGSCIGLYFTFRYRKESQSHIKTGIIVGLLGSILSLFLICCFDWIFYFIPAIGFDILLFFEYLLLLFVYYGIMFVMVGMIVGYIFGYVFRNREDESNTSPLF